MVESGPFYSSVLDPILSGLRQKVSRFVEPGSHVIDIACGTGAQLFELNGRAASITGIDLSESMIDYAQKQARRMSLKNAEFIVADATDLSKLNGRIFDVAILSLALHQFHPDQQPLILNEMKRVARRLVFLDYAVPLPLNYVGLGSRVAEFLAGREHHRNFKAYCKAGGLLTLLPKNGLFIEKVKTTAKGSFLLVEASPERNVN